MAGTIPALGSEALAEVLTAIDKVDSEGLEGLYPV